MNGEALRVLVIDDEQFHAEAVAESLERVGYECVVATSGAAGAKKIGQEDFDVIVTDLRMDGVDGMAIVRKARQELPDAEIVVITGHADVRTAVEAIKHGAAQYLEKPIDMAELRTVVDKSAERLRLARANRELKRQLDEKFGFEGVVGNSPRMHQVIDKLKAIAPTSATVLIQGETGTGKELVAKAIHTNSPRKNKPFVAMNCTALNENLLEDELFGHEPGAFTGAEKLRKGRFEHANGGTLFLDEVGDMPANLQAKLLRVLENGEVFRIGSNEPIKVNVRLLSATNRDLEKAVADGSFRQDLYYRLKVVTVYLPALRERRQDIPLLMVHFLKEFNDRHGKHVVGMVEPLRQLIVAYHWPGNVRELRNIIESMVVQDTDGNLGLDDLQRADTQGLLQVSESRAVTPSNMVGRPLTEVTRYYIEQTLQMTNNNREEAAKLLGIGERTLYRNIQQWKVQDRVQQALTEAGGNHEAAAKILGLSEKELQRRLKRWGMMQDGEK
ncbi:MAG: sigma 54-interacting transcriptional regulator [Gemmataceae bacterium]|nr:sigma 54-interacting transcriptional regulator [Gemmataceae bacterium]